MTNARAGLALLDTLPAADAVTGPALDAYAIDGLAPQIAVFPRTAEQVAQILHSAGYAAGEQGLAVSPWGGGTKQGLGNRPRRFDVALCTTRLDQVIEHVPGDLTATVQAGITLNALQEALGKAGQYLALDSPFPERATIGGILASRVSTPRRLSFGGARDLLIGVRVAHATGLVSRAGGRVVKNVTGYDLNKLYTGSLGTLGVVLEASFKLSPLPAAQRTILVAFNTWHDALAAARELVRRDLAPTGLVALDGAVASRLDALALPVSGPVLLAAELRGGRPAVERRHSELAALVRQGGAAAEALERPASDGFWQSLANLPWQPDEVAPLLVLRCGGPPSRTDELAAKLRTAVADASLTFGLLAQPAQGIVRAYGWAREATPEAQRIASLVELARLACASIASYVVVERCPRQAKALLDVWGGPDEGISLMRRLKGQFDPRSTLNPGRLMGGL